MLAWSAATNSKKESAEAGQPEGHNTAALPEGFTNAMNLLWKAEAERTEQIQAVQAELQELVLKRYSSAI